jgi:hypothetical protein
MPRKSKHLSHSLMIISVAFALLLIVTSIYAPRLKPFPDSPLTSTANNQTVDQTGIVVDTLNQENAPSNTPIDTSNWKKYRDPVYHFTIKYPSEWATPVAKKINDPDFDYEYLVSFGTADTLSGKGIEGFNVFVFPSEKCSNSSAGQQSNATDTSQTGNIPSCASKKTQISLVAPNSPNIIEFSSKVYSYTIIPLFSENDADQELVRKTNIDFQEAAKTFTFDSSLKLITPKKTSANASSNNAIGNIVRPVAPAARSGRITGGVPVAGGKYICPHPNRKPMRSPNKGNHVDEDCCPDPDEWPNSLCIYKASDYRIMLTP